MSYNFTRTPQHRYENDPVFKQLVDSLEHFLHYAKSTPSEIRDAAMLAAIHYEHHTLRQYLVTDPKTLKLWEQLDSIHAAVNKV